jgi:hypothetical protein
MHIMWTLLMLLTLTLPGLTNGQEIYRWVDEQGRVHYGAKPGGADAKRLDIKTAPPEAAKRESTNEQQRRAKQERLLRMFEEERAKKKAAKQKEERARKERLEKCQYYRDRVRLYEEGTRLYDLDSKGRRRFLTEEERKRNLARERRNVRKWCR